MATVAPTIPPMAANANSWLQRALAYLLPIPAPMVPRPIEMTIVDLRLILRRIDHARREHARWDARYLAKTIERTIIAPLEELALGADGERSRHGAIFALRPIAAIAHPLSRAGVDVAAELDEAAAHLQTAIQAVELPRGDLN